MAIRLSEGKPINETKLYQTTVEIDEIIKNATGVGMPFSLFQGENNSMFQKVWDDTAGYVQKLTGKQGDINIAMMNEYANFAKQLVAQEESFNSLYRKGYSIDKLLNQYLTTAAGISSDLFLISK